MPPDAVIHVIDDDEDIRKAMAFMLGSAGYAVRVYESATSFLSKFDATQPGCIVSDVRMPGVDGLDLQRRLKERKSDIPVIIMTGHADVPLAVEAMKIGASDFIEKPFGDDVMLNAIERALASRRHSQGDEQEKEAVRTRTATLTERERQVLSGVVAGRVNKIIAHDLGISPRTVEVHRANVMAKMAAHSLSDLVRMTLKAGIS